MKGFRHLLATLCPKKTVEKQIAELRRKRLILVWAAQEVDERIDELEKNQRGEAPEKEE